MYRLTNAQKLPISIDEVWDFLSNPTQLEKITTKELSFQKLHDIPNEMYEGMLMQLRLKPFFGIWINWLTEITHIKEKEYFIDEQRVGPFRFWHHEHRVLPIEGGVEIQDTVHYVMPFSILGRLVHWLFIRKQLEKIFIYREEEMEKMFGRLD